MPTQSSSPHLPFGENKQADWYGKDIISVKQFGRDDLEYIFGVAHEMRGMVERVGTFDLLKGKILANLFYEPSTRTSSSFTAAMERLGGSVIPINEVYDEIDGPILVMLAALIPVSDALRTTGGTELIAEGLASIGHQLPPAGALALILVTAMMVTPFLNNAATVLVMAPIATSFASGLGFKPEAFLMAVR